MHDLNMGVTVEQREEVSREASPIRVLVVHRLRLTGDLFVETLQDDCRFEAFRSPGKLEIVVAALRERRPEVVLINADWGDLEIQAVDLIRLCHSTLPGVRTVLYLDTEDDDMPIVDAFRAGSRGVLHKDDSVELLKRCLQMVAEGQIWARNDYLHHVLQALVQQEGVLGGRESATDINLSKRERDVVRCVADGLTNRDIAVRLDLSIHTVKNYLFRLFERLGVSNRAELVAYAMNNQSVVASTPSFVSQYDA
jgi:DNA-binding NarL/FixJ family response regulator